MKVYYRILSVDHQEHSIVVRYYTDLLTEEMLASDENRDENGKPVHCRTDYNLSIWKYPNSKEDIDKQIKDSAPIDWFKLKQYTLTNNKSLAHMESLISQDQHFVHEPIPTMTIDEIESILKNV